MRVLLTNDDGPPGKESPYIFGFSQHLKRNLGWDVKVVLPSSQKSWIGKAFHIKEIVRGRYYYPRSPDGLGETCTHSRPLQQGEEDEWILLDATPATCTNIALHNLFPGQIDLVLSGPNLGRNSSAAFALSSGTIGAAMSGALSQVKAIAVSYGTVVHPTPSSFHEPAHILAGAIIQQLWLIWDKKREGDTAVDLYNINIPMIQKLLDPGSLDVYWTTMWRNSYKRLFKPISQVSVVPPAGPDADPRSEKIEPDAASASEKNGLTFRFAPEFQEIISPPQELLPEGSDAWALSHGHASVTPLVASYAESAPDFTNTPLKHSSLPVESRKLKL